MLSLVASLALGCSFAMPVAPSDPSHRTAEAAQRCTVSYADPAFDLGGVVLSSANLAVALGAKDRVLLDAVLPMSKTAGAALASSQLALYSAAAVYGLVQVARCTELRKEQPVDAPVRGPFAGAPNGNGDARAQIMHRHVDPNAIPDDAPLARGGSSGAQAPEATTAEPDAASDEATTEPSNDPRTLPPWSAFKRMPLQ